MSHLNHIYMCILSVSLHCCRAAYSLEHGLYVFNKKYVWRRWRNYSASWIRSKSLNQIRNCTRSMIAWLERSYHFIRSRALCFSFCHSKHRTIVHVGVDIAFELNLVTYFNVWHFFCFNYRRSLKNAWNSCYAYLAPL